VISSPRQRMTARSMTFSSSRTFPGSRRPEEVEGGAVKGAHVALHPLRLEFEKMMGEGSYRPCVRAARQGQGDDVESIVKVFAETPSLTSRSISCWCGDKTEIDLAGAGAAIGMNSFS